MHHEYFNRSAETLFNISCSSPFRSVRDMQCISRNIINLAKIWSKIILVHFLYNNVKIWRLIRRQFWISAKIASTNCFVYNFLIDKAIKLVLQWNVLDSFSAKYNELCNKNYDVEFSVEYFCIIITNTIFSYAKLFLTNMLDVESK